MNLQLLRHPVGAVYMAGKTWLDPVAAGALIRKARDRMPMTQDQVAEALDVDKSYISKLEGGLHHAGRSKYFPQLVEVLKLTADEIRELNPAAVIDSAPAAASPGPTPARRHPIPPELQEAIELYGHRFADLHDPAWQNYLAGFRNLGIEADTAEDWLDFYRDLSRRGIRPGEPN